MKYNPVSYVKLHEIKQFIKAVVVISLSVLQALSVDGKGTTSSS